MSSCRELDAYLMPAIRAQIEERYYARITAQARLDQLAHDATFLADIERHVGFFSDHGVVHVHDVAVQILRVLDAINGVLIPMRSASRLAWMKGYGVMLAYLHDIGMVDFSPFGRAMHPEFAAQALFRAEFDELVETIWAENCGNVAWRLLRLVNSGTLTQPPHLLIRELLALAIGHSKSKVPVAVLNDPPRLRSVLQRAVGTDLQLLYRRQQVEKARQKVNQAHQNGQSHTVVEPLEQALYAAEEELAQMTTTAWRQNHWASVLARHYGDFAEESYVWLVTDQPEVSALVSDAIDTVRALRGADALRQRGAVLNTSGGYQIFVDARTANAIHAFKTNAGERLLLLETSDLLCAGEANIAGSELTRDGDLRISFHRGSFATPAALVWAVQCAAVVINDIQADVLDSFTGLHADCAGALPKPAAARQILLEGVDDHPPFAGLVAFELTRINPQLMGRCRPAPSLQDLSEGERLRYLAGAELDWTFAQKQQALTRIAASGHKTSEMDLVQAFADVKLVTVQPGETLIKAGSPPGFVYIALSAGLRGLPLGGYDPFAVQPWTPLGSTGVIRGALRNATVVAEAPVRLLMIPREVYLRCWHGTYDIAEFTRRLAELYTDLPT